MKQIITNVVLLSVLLVSCDKNSEITSFDQNSKGNYKIKRQIAINIFILVNAFIVGEKSAAESNKIAHATADVINTVKPETITSQNFPKFAYYIRKSIGHFGLFCVSGLFSTWSIYLMFSNSENCKFL